jgi:hypothetical protein
VPEDRSRRQTVLLVLTAFVLVGAGCSPAAETLPESQEPTLAADSQLLGLWRTEDGGFEMELTENQVARIKSTISTPAGSQEVNRSGTWGSTEARLEMSFDASGDEESVESYGWSRVEDKLILTRSRPQMEIILDLVPLQ